MPNIIQLNDAFTFEVVNFLEVDFIPNNSPADGVLYVQKDGKKYKRLFTGNIDIRWYKGKNINDSYDGALKACMQAITMYYRYNERKTIYFPNGLYYFENDITIKENIKLLGESKSSYISSNQKSVTNYDEKVGLYNSDIHIENMSFSNTRIKLKKGKNIHFEDIKIFNLGYQFLISDCENVKIKDSYIETRSKAIEFEYLEKKSKNITVENCIFYTTYESIYGRNQSFNYVILVENLIVQNCEFHTDSFAIELSGLEKSILQNCVFYNENSAIKLSGKMDVTINNCIFPDILDIYSGIRFYNGDDIANNTIWFKNTFAKVEMVDYYSTYVFNLLGSHIDLLGDKPSNLTINKY